MKLENFPAEWEFFLSDIGVKENVKLPWANKAQDDNYDEQQYLQKLTKNERIKLYEKYKADFIMFGYSVDNDFLK